MRSATAARRAVALYPGGDRATSSSRSAPGTTPWRTRSMRRVLSAQNLPGQLPLLAAATWTNSQTPDDQVASYVGRNVVQNFGRMVADHRRAAALVGALGHRLPRRRIDPLALLSAALAGGDSQAAQAMTLPNTPSSNSSSKPRASFTPRTSRRTPWLTWTPSCFRWSTRLPLSPSGPRVVFREGRTSRGRGRRLGRMAGGSGLDPDGESGVVLTRMVAFFFTAATGALIEIDTLCWCSPCRYGFCRDGMGLFLWVIRSLIA